MLIRDEERGRRTEYRSISEMGQGSGVVGGEEVMELRGQVLSDSLFFQAVMSPEC